MIQSKWKSDCIMNEVLQVVLQSNKTDLATRFSSFMLMVICRGIDGYIVIIKQNQPVGNNFLNAPGF